MPEECDLWKQKNTHTKKTKNLKHSYDISLKQEKKHIFENRMIEVRSASI